MALNAQDGIAGALHRIAKIAAVPAGHDERLIVVGLSHVQAHNIRKRHFGTLGRSLHAYFALEVDGRPVFTSEETDDGTDWKFPEILKFPAYPSSKLKFVICRNGKVQGSKVLAVFEARLLVYLHSGDNVLFSMKSEDSPGSSISVSLSVNAEWELIPNMLCFAKDRVDTIERGHHASSLVCEVMRSLQKLCNTVREVARIHFIAQVAYVFLYALYRTVEKQVDLDNEIKALIRLMRDVLVHIEQYRNAHGTQEENEVFGVIKVLAEGAASIDEWVHVAAIQRAARAPQLIVALQTCKKQLEELKQKHTVKSVPGGIGLRDRCV